MSPTTLSISEVKEAFPHQAAAFKVDSNHPSRSELQEAFHMLEENAIAIPCVLPTTLQFGWAVLICTDADWKIHNAEALTASNQLDAAQAALTANPPEDPDTAEYITVLPNDPSIPALPAFDNPGQFQLIPDWTDKERAVKKILHDQKVHTYFQSSYVNQALVLLMKEIFNESLFADLNRGSTIGSSALRNVHTAKVLRTHLEKKFKKDRPVDVESVMTIFQQPHDTALPMEKYFEKQQQCRDRLVSTLEPISDHTMKRAARGHFLLIPHLVEWVRKYDNDIDPAHTAPWETLRDYFISKDLEFKETQATLGHVGVANAATSDEWDDMKYLLSTLMEKNASIEESMALMMATQSDNPPATTPPAAPTLSPTASIDAATAKIIAAFQATRDPGHKPPESRQKRGAIKPDSKENGPHPKCIHYCWTHGYNFSHASPSCSVKAPGHNDAATQANKRGGSTNNLARYTGPGCPPANKL